MSRERAILVGGCSESKNCLEPFRAELATVFDQVESFTGPEAAGSKKEELARLAPGRTILAHSMGVRAIRRDMGAIRAIAIAGSEPTHRARAIFGAGHVLLHESREPEVVASLLETAEEVLRHPSHLRALGYVANFSTIKRLILAGQESFPAGRFYLPAQNDEFGFSRQEAMKHAITNGVTAAYVGDLHNHAIHHPEDTAAQIRDLLEVTPSLAA